ncbi:carbamoyltransferase N-terminal domain-containing protein [Amycolatopsis rhabdoformis]|uniref:Carbamoyltransferase N-terminal domain-containing protein n=1 Tax=Amycolatopsis rhabdoformis TaxID=1448059 RepID=A0ABZ1HZ26_9PSEU|nr:carbamoyltransferase N-terminal domain-containing protein [Amycolatopsis rhabdoformis]WSE27373.1 carbamoyltransferase N-terminal domain-containing protein [Amycolatopsis rhabdoformis]
MDDGRLVFSVEPAKAADNPRSSAIPDLRVVTSVLADFGYRPEDVDDWVLDGGDGAVPGTVGTGGRAVASDVVVGPHCEPGPEFDLLVPTVDEVVTLDGERRRYTSYSHAAGHVLSAYCTSPFARRREPAFVLVWDDGMFPRLYWVDPEYGVDNGGHLFRLIGHTYATAVHHFGPLHRELRSDRVDDFSVPEERLACLAPGKVRESIVTLLSEVFDEELAGGSERALRYRRSVGGFGSAVEPSVPALHRFFDVTRTRLAGSGHSDEDVLASVHRFLEDLLVERLTQRIAAWKGSGAFNLCFAGSCALNAQWNSALRESPMVDRMWVPPFPDDSGSAIGAAALGMIRHTGIEAIEWTVRSGPELRPTTEVPRGWISAPCTTAELARVLHETGEPVVVLDGRAELGPCALGGRSVLAAATAPRLADRVNDLGHRQHFRPGAPICVVDEAPAIFDPGTPDPYRLFDHTVRQDWLRRIPAVVRPDGTARLQTVSVDDNEVLAEILTAYHHISGIPVLCGSSGFFRDVASAAAWGGADRIWSEGTLYQRADSEPEAP